MVALTVWTRTHTVDGQILAQFGENGNTLVMEWPHIARLQCSRDGRRPRVTRFRDATPGSFAKLRGSIRALVGDLRGGLGLHASAVAIGTKAVVIVGDSGAGKSMCACELSHHHGGKLLADDAALVVVRRNVARVEPTETDHCLWPDGSRKLGLQHKSTYNEKVFVRPGKRARSGARLELVVALRFDDSLTTSAQRPLSGMAAASAILGSMFRVKEGSFEARRLDLVQRLHESVPFVEIARPHTRPSVAQAIIDLLNTPKERA